MRVRTAVFPAAGLGTRFLPATKAQPKEMLPLVDKPMIQYVVEEAVAAGLDRVCIVTGRGKRAIEDHFDASVELEFYLQERGKWEELAQIKTISDLASVSYVRQKEPLGLGHAILCAQPLVGDEPFAVFLGDDIIVADPPCISQLLAVLRAARRPRPGRRAGARVAALAVRRHPRDAGGGERLPGGGPGREAGARGGALRPGHHRPLRPDARTSSRSWPRRRPTTAARSSSPTPSAASGSAGRSTPCGSPGAASTPARSSGS